MLQDGVDYPVYTVTGLDYMRHDIFAVNLGLDLLHLVKIGWDNDLLAVEFDLCPFFGWRGRGKCIGDGLRTVAVFRPECTHIGDDLRLLNSLRFFVLDEDSEWVPALRRMGLQVVIRPVGDTDCLHPAEPIR